MTSRSKGLSLALVVGALGLVLVRVQRANDAKMRALEGEIQKASKAGELAIASAQTAERVVPALLRQAAAAQPEPAREAPTEAPAAPAVNEPPDRAAAVEAAIAYRAKQAAYVDDLYARQAVDKAWAQPARDGLTTQLSKSLGTSTLESVDCRESLCKARITHHDQAGYDKFLSQLQASRDTWNGAFWLYRDPTAEGEETVQNSIYFAREGTNIPTPRP